MTAARDARNDQIMAARADGVSYQEIADKLNADGVPLSGGGPWTAGFVHQMVKRLKLLQQGDT